MLKNYTAEAKKYGVIEITLEGPADGNPFADHWVKGTFESASETKDVEGFYDGNGIYKVRCMPSFEEKYCCRITTDWGDTEEVTVSVGEAEAGRFSGSFIVPFPARPYMAARVTVVE